jgi:2-dehydro-3-deoxyglucarate aldolase/4-hydroxy-2-oxoheptanedioate aldolase
MDEARAFVSAAKFPPCGERRFGIVYSDALDSDLDATLARYNRDTLLIGQIETAAGADAVNEIAAVDGLDVLWVGSYDLSISLGIPGAFDSPAYVAAVDRVLAACERQGKTAGILVESPEEGFEALERGYRCLMYSFDVALYENSLRAGMDTLRRGSHG